MRWRRVLGGFENLLDPSRNHRAYRLYTERLKSPFIPFLPLVLKDLTFICEGNETAARQPQQATPAGNGPSLPLENGTNKSPSHQQPLVNFEKMHALGNVLRSFRYAKSQIACSQLLSIDGVADKSLEAMVR